jgi:two-component system sensor histidine kinase UhpB
MMEKYAGIENTALFKVLQHCMQERVPETFENEFIYPDGTKSWFELSIQPIPEGLFILSINITARKKVEIELADQQLKQQKLIIETTIHAQEKERNELGRELHDNINQILATVKLYLNVAKSDVNNREELLEKSHQFVSTAIEETRKLSHILVAPSLGNITLHDVLEKLAHEENLCNGLRVEFINKTGKKISFDKSKELMLYRIAQEQINNIRKHAQAKKVLINLNASAQNIIFSITDNGIGFDPGKKAHGIGLKNITSRVQYYSGKTNLISSPGKGCTLEVIVPL